jgi:hypothetical protein
MNMSFLVMLWVAVLVRSVFTFMGVIMISGSISMSMLMRVGVSVTMLMGVNQITMPMFMGVSVCMSV